MQCPGENLADAAARELFENFDDLCRGVTIGHYHNLGVPGVNNCLVPVKLLVSASNSPPARTEESRAPALATIPFKFDEPPALQATAHQG
jgi:hypothetical protein